MSYIFEYYDHNAIIRSKYSTLYDLQIDHYCVLSQCKLLYLISGLFLKILLIITSVPGNGAIISVPGNYNIIGAPEINTIINASGNDTILLVFEGMTVLFEVINETLLCLNFQTIISNIISKFSNGILYYIHKASNALNLVMMSCRLYSVMISFTIVISNNVLYNI